MLAQERIIVALDFDSPEDAIELVEEVKTKVGSFKIGLEFITAILKAVLIGTEKEAMLKLFKIRDLFFSLKDKLFLDGKFHDISNTVGKASKNVGELFVKMFNLHASAGIKAMQAAVENRSLSKVLAVTVLTSLEENEAHLIYGAPSKAKVLQFARDAKSSGCNGIICSAQELPFFEKYENEFTGFKKVTPGIRSSDDPKDDQNRTMNSYEAIRHGADELVIGRPITKNEKLSPADAVKKITEEIKLGLKHRFFITLFNLKKIEFGRFKLKLHEKNPNAPLSPIYLNIRELPDWLYTLAGNIIHDFLDQENIDLNSFDYVIGIPKAGKPIGEALAKTINKPFLNIEKIESEEGRKITSKILDPFKTGKNVLLVDDLITKADTKLEAIKSIEDNGLKVITTIVLVDREQGGLIGLNKVGCKTLAIIKMSQLLDFFISEGKITEEKKTEVMEYIKNN